jgi:hypothetical protein
MASEPAPMIEDALPAPAKTKKLALRLDNGTLIRPNGQAAEVLTPSRAMEEGLLSEAHLLKMQALLCEVHAKLPEEGPLKSISLGSKRSLDSVLEVRAQQIEWLVPACLRAPFLHLFRKRLS